jgi:hypothetical protein
MESLRQKFLMLLLLIGFSSGALAENDKHPSVTTVASPETSRPGLTGKERLGPKWTDEQRIDNCKVPFDKRGPKPRPSACAAAPPS